MNTRSTGLHHTHTHINTIQLCSTSIDLRRQSSRENLPHTIRCHRARSCSILSYTYFTL